MNSPPGRKVRLGLLCVPLILVGCVSTGPAIDITGKPLPPRVELLDTEFFPQQEFHCGPAALATVLRHARVDVTPEQLVDLVYIPRRRGALQAEMLAAARRHRRVAYALPPHSDALFAELASGRPVLVLQNLGLSKWPAWHYAVLIGYDSADDTVTLRSGTSKRLRMPAERFLRTWERGGRWAMVALTVDAVPAVPDGRAWLSAIAALERTAPPADLERAYITYLGHFPGDDTAILGLANAQLAGGRIFEAEALYRDLLARRPGYVPARNNLAWSLTERHCVKEALVQVEMALRDTEADDVLYRQALSDTRRRIIDMPAGSGERCQARVD